MAPEQLRGAPARRRSDLFAVGAVVYHVGTGRHPFFTPGIATREELYETMEQPPLDPRTLSLAFDDSLATVVLRLLSLHAHERLSVTKALTDLGGN
jgi:serine/threonine protein kinase